MEINLEELYQNILDKLSYIDSSTKWIVLGEVVLELEAISLPNAQQISWLRVAIERMSANQDPIGMGYGYKIIRTYKFLRDLSNEHPDISPQTFEGCPIGAIEIATRIFKFDKDLCLKALRSIKEGQSAADISKLYQDIRESSDKRDARNNAAISQRIDTRRAIDFIKENQHEIYGNASQALRIFQVKGRRKLSGTGVSFFSRSKGLQNTEVITGFDVVSVNQGSSNWYNIRPKICFNSTFFKSYWIVIQCGHDEIEHIKHDILVLGIANAGIIHINKNEIIILLTPTGVPVPDRSHLF